LKMAACQKQILDLEPRHIFFKDGKIVQCL
jgi:hypothetical protein